MSKFLDELEKGRAILGGVNTSQEDSSSSSFLSEMKKGREILGQTSEPSKPELERGIGGFALDTGIDLLKGAVGLGETVVGLGDIVTGNALGDTMEEYLGYDPKRTKEILSEGYSDARKAANLEVEKAEGFVDTLSTYTENPSALFGQALESLPQMAGTVGAGRMAAGSLLKKYGADALKDPKNVAKVAAVSRLAEGATVAGMMQEGFRQDDLEWSDTFLKSLGAGAGTAAISKLASKIPGFKDFDVEAQAALAGLQETGKAGVLAAGKTVAKSMFQEGVLEEMPQSTQEQVWDNLGRGKPWDEGLSKAAASGLVLGAATGGAISTVTEARKGTFTAASENAPTPTNPETDINKDTRTGKAYTDKTVSDAAAKISSLEDAGNSEAVNKIVSDLEVNNRDKENKVKDQEREAQINDLKSTLEKNRKAIAAAKAQAEEKIRQEAEATSEDSTTPPTTVQEATTPTTTQEAATAPTEASREDIEQLKQSSETRLNNINIDASEEAIIENADDIIAEYERSQEEAEAAETLEQDAVDTKAAEDAAMMGEAEISTVPEIELPEVTDPTAFPFARLGAEDITFEEVSNIQSDIESKLKADPENQELRSQLNIAKRLGDLLSQKEAEADVPVTIQEEPTSEEDYQDIGMEVPVTYEDLESTEQPTTAQQTAAEIEKGMSAITQGFGGAALQRQGEPVVIDETQPQEIQNGLQEQVQEDTPQEEVTPTVQQQPEKVQDTQGTQRETVNQEVERLTKIAEEQDNITRQLDDGYSDETGEELTTKERAILLKRDRELTRERELIKKAQREVQNRPQDTTPEEFKGLTPDIDTQETIEDNSLGVLEEKTLSEDKGLGVESETPLTKEEAGLTISKNIQSSINSEIVTENQLRKIAAERIKKARAEGKKPRNMVIKADVEKALVRNQIEKDSAAFKEGLSPVRSNATVETTSPIEEFTPSTTGTTIEPEITKEQMDKDLKEIFDLGSDIDNLDNFDDDLFASESNAVTTLPNNVFHWIKQIEGHLKKNPQLDNKETFDKQGFHFTYQQYKLLQLAIKRGKVRPANLDKATIQSMSSEEINAHLESRDLMQQKVASDETHNILQREVGRVTSRIDTGEIDIVYVESDTDLPMNIKAASLANGSGNGWFYREDGKKPVIYLVGNNINKTAISRGDIKPEELIREVIAHELVGHYGLYNAFKNIYGDFNTYRNFLEKEGLRNKKLMLEAAKALMGNGRYLKYASFVKPEGHSVEIQALRNGKLVKAWISKENYAKVLDEFIALRAESIPRGGFRSNIENQGFWKKVYNMIRHAFRKIGIANLSNEDIDRMLIASHDHLMNKISKEQIDTRLKGVLPFRMMKDLQGRGQLPVSEADAQTQPMFMGERSLGMNPETYARAIELEQKGYSNKKVWEQTGWFRGVDGVLRFEVTDKDAEFKTKKGRVHKLKNLLEHPQLFDGDFDAYGDKKALGNITVIFDLPNPGDGVYYPKKDEIHLSYYDFIKRPTEAMKIILHEIQHAVQYREGFAVGGSYRQFETTYQEMKKQAENAYKQIKRITAEAFKDTGFKNYPEARKEIQAQLKNGTITQAEADQLTAYFQKIRDKLKSNPAYNYFIKTIDKVPTISQFDWTVEEYNRLAGEVESRLVEERYKEDVYGEKRPRDVYPVEKYDRNPDIQNVITDYSLMASEMDSQTSQNMSETEQKVHKEVQSTLGKQLAGVIDAIQAGKADIHRTALEDFSNKVTDWVRNTWVGKYYSALGDMRHQEIYNIIDNQVKGKIQAAEDFAKKIEIATKKLTPAQGKDVMKFFTTKDASVKELISITGLTEQQANLLMEAKQNIVSFGSDLVKLGKLSPEVFEDSKGSYLPYMYMKYAEQIPVGGKKTSFLDYLKKRGNLSALDKDVLGKIEDPNIVLPQFLGTIGRDVALLQMGKATIELNNEYKLGWILNTAKRIDTRRNTGTGKKLLMNEYEIQERVEEIERALIDGIDGPVHHRTAEQHVDLQGELEHYKKLLVVAKAYRIKEVKEILLRDKNIKPEDITSERIQKFLDSEFKKLPSGPEFGTFRGKYVHRGIYNDFVDMDDVIKAKDSFAANFLGTGGFYAKAHTYWKGSKVVMNIPVSTFRNFMGAITQLDTGSSTSLPILLKNMTVELESVLNDYTGTGKVSEWWELGKRFGLHGATFSAAEMNALSRTKIMKLKREMEMAGKDKTFTGHLLDLTGKGKEGINVLFEEASKIYGLQEALFKTVAMRDYVETFINEKGKDIWNSLSDIEKEAVYHKAAVHANEIIYDYTRVPPWVKVMRRLPIGGAPFMTFAYKAGPQSAKNLIAHPIKHVKYAALGYILAEAAMEAFDWDDEEFEWYQKNLDKAFKDFGTMYVLPVKDAQGRPQFVNLEYMFPWSQWWKAGKSIAQGAATGEVDKTLQGVKGAVDQFGFLTGPAMDLIYSAETGEMKFGGKSIISPESTTNAEKINDILRWQVSMWFPPILTSNGALGNYLDSLGVSPTPLNLGDKYNKMFQEKETGGQIFSRVVGMNTYGRTPQQLRQQNQKTFEFELKKLDTQRSKIVNSTNLSQSVKIQKIREIHERQKLLREKHRKLMER